MAEKCIKYLELALEEIEKSKLDDDMKEAHREIIEGLIDDIKIDYEEMGEEVEEGEDEESESEDYDKMSDEELEKKAYDHLDKEEKKKKPTLVIAIGHEKK